MESWCVVISPAEVRGPFSSRQEAQDWISAGGGDCEPVLMDPPGGF